MSTKKERLMGIVEEISQTLPPQIRVIALLGLHQFSQFLADATDEDIDTMVAYIRSILDWIDQPSESS